MISMNCRLLLRLHWALGITWISRGNTPALQASAIGLVTLQSPRARAKFAI